MAGTKSVMAGGEAGGRIRVGSSGESAPIAGPGAREIIEFIVGVKSFQTLRTRKDAVRKLLTNYATAVSRAENLGKPVDMTITVRPGKATPTVTSEPAGGDDLDQALADARARGKLRVAEILRLPEMATARELGEMIGASHETVNQKRKSGEILALEGATRGLRYPRWQVTPDGRLLPGLVDLFQILGSEPWTIYRFLLERHGELKGESALDSLKRNRVDEVLFSARNLAQGAFA